MPDSPSIDGVLITWGDRLFYPGNRRVRGPVSERLRAAVIRGRIEATVVRRSPQVMVKVSGSGRNMKAIAAHFRYISQEGRLELEDQRGEVLRGKDELRGLAEEWRLSGSLIPSGAEPGHRREAFNIMLSMPRGTDPLCVLRAAREFARQELDGHKYVMVLHDHQANPHVHLTVRAESRSGRRLHPGPADLHRWRDTFAERLRGYGIDAEATRQATRGESRAYEPLWRFRARADSPLRDATPGRERETWGRVPVGEANVAWEHIRRALSASLDAQDRALARAISAFVEKGARQLAVHEPGREAMSAPVRTSEQTRDR